MKKDLYSWKKVVFDSADGNAEDHEKIRVQVTSAMTKIFWGLTRWQNDRHFVNSIFKPIFLNRMTSYSISNTISLKYVPNVSVVHNKHQWLRQGLVPTMYLFCYRSRQKRRATQISYSYTEQTTKTQMRVSYFTLLTRCLTMDIMEYPYTCTKELDIFWSLHIFHFVMHPGTNF